ncbi:MAG: 4-hydroxythreonine-4-phosphate dehydrogenase PdxA [Candidatus Omnitrophica bacterium]|nr:4-hydroxythreonine-4-phosphate dehydrogenase PdxA [Candidatus Omnitrophota bacterium]
MPKVRVGITIGDPSGIGPEITIKAMRKLKGYADFVVIGDACVWNKAAGIKFIDLGNVKKNDFQPGQVRGEYGRASIEYLDKALELLENRQIDCLVTCPISKEALNKGGFKFGGHTEYLAARANRHDLVMMLLNQCLRISLVTRHIPLKDVARDLKSEDLYKNILLTHWALKSLFAIKRPRIVVAGLNPHASDNGVIGKEENRLILPVLKRLKHKSISLDGPLSADVAIAKAAKNEYDCVIAMYHDQALIPLKLLGNASGVNLTVGLPFIRTSPLHGTAFDIAGKGLARADSLISAIKLAVKCTLNQKNA